MDISSSDKSIILLLQYSARLEREFTRGVRILYDNGGIHDARYIIPVPRFHHHVDYDVDQ